jgi:hypothetical protein
MAGFEPMTVRNFVIFSERQSNVENGDGRNSVHARDSKPLQGPQRRQEVIDDMPKNTR